MANQVHLKILKQGVKAWNDWRKVNPGVTPDLYRAQLTGEDLRSRTDRRIAQMYYTTLNTVSKLRDKDIDQISLKPSQVHTILNLSGIDLSKNRLNLESLNEAHYRLAYLNRPKFITESGLRIIADLSGIDFSGADLTNADLSGADLSGSNLIRAELVCADLSEANLMEANLSHARLLEAKFTGANLTKANLQSTDLGGADLARANLSSAICTASVLVGAHLLSTELNNVVFQGAVFGHTTISNIDLRTVIGLESVSHWSPSSIGIDTVYLSSGRIPEVFLRGAGVSDNFIEYMHSLTNTAFDFYSCFISYSSKDQSFVERLHADLQNKGVRCWYAPEEMKTGDRIRQTIFDQIRLHEKLLVILSENSIASDWVEDEVDKAIEEERRHDKQMLFPIRLDDTIMETDESWAAKIRQQRHITDFSGWKQHDTYQQAFDRLMRDLKAKSRPKIKGV